MTFTPTQEQLDIIEAFKHTRVLKVNASAGSGKTSTLKMLADANVVPSIYLSFNRAIADEASSKFPRHVSCRSQHQVAYAVFGKMLAHKLTRPKGNVYINVAGTVSEIVKYYKIDDFQTSEDTVLARSVGTLVKETVQRYQYSKDTNLELHHISKKSIKEITKGIDESKVKDLQYLVLRYANKVWKDKVNPLSPVLAEHDTYLKLWQLSNPVLPYEIIYLDESQDTNPVIYDVVSKQTHCKIVYVGDKHQSIYAFRQAINAMEKIEAPEKYLTKSFRFGQNIADVATFIINGQMDIKGAEWVDSHLLDHTPQQYAMLFRTNAGLIDQAVRLIAEGKRIRCDIDTYKFEQQLKSAEALLFEDHKNVKDETVALYSKWADLLDALDEHIELKRVVDVVTSGRTKMYLQALSKLKKQQGSYDILLVTAHKSKGMEWDNVVIADDFDLQKVLDVGGKINEQEVNLFYVACTRAKLGLKLPEEFLEVYDNMRLDFNIEDFDDSEINTHNQIPVSISCTTISFDDVFMDSVRDYKHKHGNFLFNENDVFEDEIRSHYN